jgi:hypothetical protein
MHTPAVADHSIDWANVKIFIRGYDDTDHRLSPFAEDKYAAKYRCPALP